MKQKQIEIKVLYFLFIHLLLVMAPSYASDQQTDTQFKTRYLRVSGHGSSFSITPSMHGPFEIPFPVFYVTAVTKQVMGAKGLCLEADSVSAISDIKTGQYAQKMLIHDDFNIFRYINDPEKLLILANNAKLSPQQAEKYFSHATPYAIQQDALTGAFSTKNKTPSLDKYLTEFARIVKVPIHYLENSSEGAEQVIRTLPDIEGWRVSLLKLADFLECDDCKKKLCTARFGHRKSDFSTRGF